jgi:uncharacterized membrane protein
LALALPLVALAPSVSLADCIQAQPIYAHNNTGRPIWVAAHYVPAGSQSFVSDGWWEVAPGQCQLLLYNNGRWIYFNARDDQGHTWDGSAITTTVRGQNVGMFQRDTGMCYDPWTLDFNPQTLPSAPLPASISSPNA